MAALAACRSKKSAENNNRNVAACSDALPDEKYSVVFRPNDDALVLQGDSDQNKVCRLYFSEYIDSACSFHLATDPAPEPATAATADIAEIFARIFSDKVADHLNDHGKIIEWKENNWEFELTLGSNNIEITHLVERQRHPYATIYKVNAQFLPKLLAALPGVLKEMGEFEKSLQPSRAGFDSGLGSGGNPSFR
jgi:hypothetical protein